MIVPLAMTLWFSFQRYNLITPSIGGFAGSAT
jgi:sorbitol/mannitol transport system permease protein